MTSAREEVAVVLGTRPEAVKLAPVILALRESKQLACRVYSTGQHREMLDQTLSIFSITPDVDLGLMRANQTLGELTGDAVSRLSRLFEEHRPAMTLVQGDTTTAMCAALASYYCGVPVGHVEAGLRTGDKRAPFPEEINRRFISVLADLHFAPTDTARANLVAENIPADRIVVTGNTGIDSVLHVLERVKRGDVVEPAVPGRRAGHRLVLVTGHRRESFGEALRSMCLALGDLAREFPDVDFIYPAHLNPGVQAQVTETLRTAMHPNLQVTAPIEYGGFVALMSQASLIITDSGGIQEEAFALRTPVLVTRTVTERTEGLADGLVWLVGTARDAIRDAGADALRSPAPEWNGANPYGDGQASARIVERLERELTGRPTPARD